MRFINTTMIVFKICAITGILENALFRIAAKVRNINIISGMIRFIKFLGSIIT